jgi:aminoglycoside 3-N-acetyltransferase
LPRWRSSSRRSSLRASAMGFAAYSKDALEQHIRALGVERGMSIVVHSSLLAFGKLEGKAAGVLGAFRTIIGDDASIAVPTFTFSLAPGEPFDPERTPPRGMGSFAELIWRLPGAHRSPSCIHSYAAIGALSELLPGLQPDRSFGEDSFFDLAIRRNLYWVMLGCGIEEGCTLLHHTEAAAGVPYREWLTLDRQLRCSDGSISSVKYKYYARKRNDVEQDFAPVSASLVAAGRMRRIRAPYGESLAGWSQDIHQAGLALLKRDPLSLVKATGASSAA